jgi:hypothetical protein
MAGYCKHDIALAFSPKFREINGYVRDSLLLDKDCPS